MTWGWCSFAIAIAFHWSPAAMAYSLASEYWIGFIVSIPLMLWDGMRMAMGYWLAAKVTSDLRWIWLPSACVTILLESVMPGVFPWKSGLPFLHAPWLIQGVDIFGPSWTTVIDCLLAGAFIALFHFSYDIHKSRVWRTPRLLRPSSVLLIAALACNAVYCTYSWTYWDRAIANAPPIRIAMVQVDPGYQGSLGEMQGFTNGIAHGVSLVCWPESSGGTLEKSLAYLSDNELTFRNSQEPLRGIRPWPNPKCELLLGGKNFYKSEDGSKEVLHVTAMLIDESERITGRNNKRQLMPFGEYVPFGNWIPALDQLFDMQDIIEPGTEAEVLTSRSGAKLGTFLCYEDMIPSVARELVHGGANLLVSLINGSAFESPFTLEQHRLLAQSRAIETRRYFVRCAATGETCIISPQGVVTERIPLNTKGVLVGDVVLLEGLTIHSQYPFLLVVLAGACLPYLFVVFRSTNPARNQLIDEVTQPETDSTEFS